MIDIVLQRKLVVQLYETTGTRVSEDDPLIIASVFLTENFRTTLVAHQQLVESQLGTQQQQFEKLLESQQQLMDRQFAELTKALDGGVATSVKRIAERADRDRVELKREYSQMLQFASDAVRGEVPSIKQELENFAKALFKSKRNHQPAIGPELKYSLGALLGGMMFSAACVSFVLIVWFKEAGIRVRPVEQDTSPRQEQQKEPFTTKSTKAKPRREDG